MKKLLAFILLLCVAASVSAYAEGFELSKELTGFTNEITGETVYLGMNMEEIEAVAGIAYRCNVVTGGRWAFYEGGLMVKYSLFETTAVDMTVAAYLINDKYPMNRDDASERLYKPGTHSAAVRKDTGAEISEGMLREEVEAITGAPIRETYIGYEYAGIDIYKRPEEFEVFEYTETEKLLSWEGDGLETIAVPGITKVDYEGISIGYRTVEEDGVSYSFVADDNFVDSGIWYRQNCIAPGASGKELIAQLGENAVVQELEDGCNINVVVHFAEDGAKFTTSVDALNYFQELTDTKGSGASLAAQADMLRIGIRVSGDDEISRVETGYFGFFGV